MKRFTAIVLLLSVALLIFPVFVPVSAAETEGQYFNVLDYTGVDDGLSNTFDVVGSTTISYNLSTTLGQFPCYGFELTYSYDGVQPSVSSFRLNNSSYAVTSNLVTPGLVRVRGDFHGDVGDAFTITFSSSSSTSVNIHSFNVYTCGFSSSAISGMMVAGNTQVAFDGINSASINPPYGTSLSVRSDWWRNYDYIDIYLTLSALGVNSISAFVQETISGTQYLIPYEVNYLNTFFDSTQLRDYEVQLRLDLTRLDRSTIPDALLRLEFDLDWTSNSTLACTMHSFRGFVFSDPVDSTAKWHQVLFTNLSNWFLSVVSAVTNLDQSITNLFDGWFAQLEGWISDQTDAIIEKLDEVMNSTELENSQHELDSAIMNFESYLEDRNDWFSDIGLLLDEPSSHLSALTAYVGTYMAPTSAWGKILSFCWEPFGYVSQYMLLMVGLLFLVSVLFIKR